MSFSKDFPIIKKYHYLDNASSSLKPKQVIEKMNDYYLNNPVNVHRGIYKLSEQSTNDYESTRDEVAKFFNSKSTEVVFNSGTTFSLNLLASSIGKTLKKNDLVLLTEMEHHSNIVPWLMLKELKQIRIEFVKLNKDKNLDYEQFEKLIIEKKPKVVSMVHASNILGTINDVKKISKLCNQNGIILILDVAQSAPHLKIDFKNIGADYITFSAHKMLGPSGLGIIIGKENNLENLYPYLGGGNMISVVKKNMFTCANLPNKFEAGTPNISGVVSFKESLKYIKKIGFDTISDNDNLLKKYSLNRAKEYEFLDVVSNKKDSIGMMTFSIDKVHSHDVSQILDQYNVCVRSGHHCSQILHESIGRKNTTRASFYFYNTKEDVDALFDGIEKVKKVFKL